MVGGCRHDMSTVLSVRIPLPRPYQIDSRCGRGTKHPQRGRCADPGRTSGEDPKIPRVEVHSTHRIFQHGLLLLHDRVFWSKNGLRLLWETEAENSSFVGSLDPILRVHRCTRIEPLHCGSSRKAESPYSGPCALCLNRLAAPFSPSMR